MSSLAQAQFTLKAASPTIDYILIYVFDIFGGEFYAAIKLGGIYTASQRVYS